MFRTTGLGCTLLLCLRLIAAAPQDVKIAAKGQGDVWTGVNVKGKVSLQIRTRDGKNRAKLWWIGVVGNVKQLGEHGPSAAFDIPPAYGKLRAQAFESDT